VITGRADQDTARSLGISAGGVASVVTRANALALSWEAVRALGDDALERALCGPKLALTVARPEPNLVWMHTELRRAGVTLELLYLEYLAAHPDGYRYSAFCGHYRRWLAQQRRRCAKSISPARRPSSTTLRIPAIVITDSGQADHWRSQP